MNITTRCWGRLLGVGLVVVLTALSTSVVSSAVAGADSSTVLVTNCSASGSGSLPNAVATAPSGATILFTVACPSAHPITLASGTIEIGQSLNIRGPGAARIAVDGGNLNTVFQVDSDCTVTISGITIQNGYGPAETPDAGGVTDFGTLTVSNSILTNNHSAYGGGAINNFGTLTVSNSIISKNGAVYGGGISNQGAANLSNSLVSNNTASGGGGIANSDTLTMPATMVVSNSILSNNSATYGGGIDNGFGTVTLSNSTLSDNSAPGSVGGGIYNGSGVSGVGRVSVVNSLLWGNSAAGGGGIDNYLATVTLSGSLVWDNNAADGGGIDNLDGTVNITNGHFAGNTGTSTPPYTGIYNMGGTLKVDSTSTFA